MNNKELIESLVQLKMRVIDVSCSISHNLFGIEDDIQDIIDKLKNSDQNQIVIVSDEGGDWAGLYVAGNLKYENHSIPKSEVTKAAKIEIKNIEINMEELGIYELPKNLTDLKLN